MHKSGTEFRGTSWDNLLNSFNFSKIRLKWYSYNLLVPVQRKKISGIEEL